jgi:hypothetical protein
MSYTVDDVAEHFESALTKIRDYSIDNDFDGDGWACPFEVLAEIQIIAK